MRFAKIRRFVENSRRYVIGAGILLLALGFYAWIGGNTYTGIFIILLGMNAIFTNFIERKWSLICAIVTLGLAMWITFYVC